MSTYWGYACRSHNPPLLSEMWLNHGDRALEKTLASYRSGHWPVDEWDCPVPMSFSGMSWHGPVAWLREHPNCDVGIINEYHRFMGEDE